MHCGYFDTTKRAITLLFWHKQWLVGDGPFSLKFSFKVTRRLRQISTYNVLAVRDSENRSITTNRKSSTGYRWSGYVILKSPKGWLKKRFVFFKINFNFSRVKSATKFLCVKTFSGRVVVNHSPISRSIDIGSGRNFQRKIFPQNDPPLHRLY